MIQSLPIRAAGAARSCRCTDLFAGKRVARWVNFEAVALRKLQQLHAVTSLDFLRIPPGNQLEALKRDRIDQLSIRINQQWRVCFVRADGHAQAVEIVDCH